MSKAELDADVAPNLAGLQNTQLYRALVEQGVGTLGGAPWTAIVGQFNFGANAADVQLLAGLGAVAASAGGPFLASAEPSVLGVHSPEDIAESSSWQRTAEADAAWQALRTSPVASWIGLALPRILLRLPYGEETDPADAFDFEEMPGGSRHEAYLWGNPAVGCALLLGTSFLERGESMEPGDDLDIDDLPAHVYEAEDGRTIKPCAEASVSERAAHSILAEGIMPVVSYRNRNSVRVLRFQSVAEPPAPLSGRWQ